MELKDTAIRNAKPKERQYKIYDSGGLFLLITPSGGKLWRLKFSFDNKEKTLAIGKYPETSLKLARQKRDEAKELLARGIDPAAQKREAKQKAIEDNLELSNTFERIAREWFEKVKSQWSDGHQKHTLARLENQLFPYIGNVPISRLETTDYLEAIKKAEARGAIETAHKLAQLCGQIARYAVHAGITKYDTASLVKGALTRITTKHFPAITDPKEFGHLLVDIDSYQGDPAITHALKIIPYVFVRSGELRKAVWDELDLDGGQWLIPAERMKMKRPHIVPLAPQVVKLFISMRDYSSNSKFIFPGRMSNTSWISDVGLLNALRRIGYGKDKMTIHGFRSSASTMLNEQGYNRDWIEAQLAHAEKNAVRDAYNRAEYLPERTKMMNEWADYIDGLRAQALSNSK